MKDMLVSVIVPVYNTERYLDRCIASIAGQSHQNLEILLIDDGSPDRCPQICDVWAERDGRVRVFHKKNEGQGIARNVGMDHARGDYLCFLDSDDYIAPDTLAECLAVAGKEQAELVTFGFHTVSPQGERRASFVPDGTVPLFFGEAVRREFLPELIAPDPKGSKGARFYMSACMMLFDAAAVRRQNWRFVSEREIISEDTYSVLKLLAGVQRVAVLPKALYHYCENEDSFSRAYLPGRYPRIRRFYLESRKLCEELGYGEAVASRLQAPFLSFTIGAMKQLAGEKGSVAQRWAELEEMVRDPLLCQAVAERTWEGNWKHRLLYAAIRRKASLACFVLCWLQNKMGKRRYAGDRGNV